MEKIYSILKFHGNVNFIVTDVKKEKVTCDMEKRRKFRVISPLCAEYLIQSIF